MAAKRQSKKQYLAKRKRRVRELYLEGYEPRIIAEKLVADGTLETSDTSLDSPIRLVRADVAAIKKAIDGHRERDADKQFAGGEIDILERELERLRVAYAKQIAISNDERVVKSTMVIDGRIYVTEKAKWPAGVRQKAAKDAATTAKDISKVEVAIAEKREQQPRPGEKGAQPGAAPFEIVMTGSSMDALIQANSDAGKVN